jgi:hypothetical protein
VKGLFLITNFSLIFRSFFAGVALFSGLCRSGDAGFLPRQHGRTGQDKGCGVLTGSTTEGPFSRSDGEKIEKSSNILKLLTIKILRSFFRAYFALSSR